MTLYWAAMGKPDFGYLAGHWEMYSHKKVYDVYVALGKARDIMNRLELL